MRRAGPASTGAVFDAGQRWQVLRVELFVRMCWPMFRWCWKKIGQVRTLAGQHWDGGQTIAVALPLTMHCAASESRCCVRFLQSKFRDADETGSVHAAASTAIHGEYPAVDAGGFH